MLLRPLMMRLTFCMELMILAGSTAAGENKAASSGFHFPATGVCVDKQAILLAIDDVSLPLKENVCYYLSKPKVRKEPVLAPSRDNPTAPDHLAAHFYGSVLYDEGKFRMWYYPVSFGRDFTELTQGPVCYAESDDGIQWTKPNLGQIEFKGSKNHNGIKLPEKVIEGVHVIKDEDDPDPARRYKMVYNPHNGRTFTIQTATSPDGIHWRTPAAYPKDQFLEQAGFFKFNGMYLVHGQGLEMGEGGGARGRQGYAWVSYDFDNWLTATAEAFALAEPAEIAERGTTNLTTRSISAWRARAWGTSWWGSTASGTTIPAIKTAMCPKAGLDMRRPLATWGWWSATTAFTSGSRSRDTFTFRGSTRR